MALNRARNEQIVKQVSLEGVSDLHVHTAPDVGPRLMDDFELARAGAKEGMRALLLKSHHTLTADRASLVDWEVDGIRIFGGLALNDAVGGLNPAAVEAAISMGAREIWMPTISAMNHLRFFGIDDKGIQITDDQGTLKPVVIEILELIAEADIILGSGHLSVREIVPLVDAARELGVRRIVITHPELSVVNMPIDVQERLRKPGVFFERCLVSTLIYEPLVPIHDIAHAIQKVGAESTILATDFGQVSNPSPIEGMRYFISAMLENGILPPDVDRMTKVNPSNLLDLE